MKPANELVLEDIAGVCQKTGDYQSAVDYLDRLIKLNPSRSRDHMRRATMLSELDRWSEAIADAEIAIEIDPTDRVARRWLMNAAQSTGDFATSRRQADVLKRMTE